MVYSSLQATEEQEKNRGYLVESGHKLLMGQTIYTILRSVSRSGMTRTISLVYFVDNEPLYLDYTVSKILGLKMAKDGGIKVNGAGMDMGFYLVDSFAQATHLKFRQRWL